MTIQRCLLRCAAIAIVFGTISAANHLSLGGGALAPARTSSASPQEKTFELQASLFVQDAHLKNGKKAVQLVWIPQQIQKYCIGKMEEECSTIDYCIRTTNKHASMCQNLSVDTSRLPPYPLDARPRRVLSIVYFFPMSPDNGFGRLAEFFENASPGSLDRLSTSARVSARVKLTRTADDDQFEVLEVLAAPQSK